MLRNGGHTSELSIAEFAIENGFGNSVASFEEETYE